MYKQTLGRKKRIHGPNTRKPLWTPCKNRCDSRQAAERDQE